MFQKPVDGNALKRDQNMPGGIQAIQVIYVLLLVINLKSAK